MHVFCFVCSACFVCRLQDHILLLINLSRLVQLLHITSYWLHSKSATSVALKSVMSDTLKISYISSTQIGHVGHTQSHLHWLYSKVSYSMSVWYRVGYICSTQNQLTLRVNTSVKCNKNGLRSPTNLLPVSITKVCVYFIPFVLFAGGKKHIPFVVWLISASTITPMSQFAAW